VILSGGLADEPRALSAFEESGAEAIMLARGALGNPWLFGRLLGTYQGEPEPQEVLEEVLWVIDCAEDHLGVERAGRYLRKFYPWYAERLGLTRREREPLVTAPTTAHAREIWSETLGSAAPIAA
jgi:tRNA-dihydrouridine synthase